MCELFFVERGKGSFSSKCFCGCECFPNYLRTTNLKSECQSTVGPGAPSGAQSR